MKQARDGAVYNRQQKGHSIVKHLLFGPLVGYMNIPFVIYFAFSPNHYFHA